MTTVKASRPLGRFVENWRPPPPPEVVSLAGQYATLERLSADRHAAMLHRAFQGHAEVWDYMPYGPFSASSQYHRWVRTVASGTDPYFFAIQDRATKTFSGVASFLRIDPNAGAIEVGHINFSPELQRTRAATEALYLMMEWVFEAGYRRFEWKCDALNAGSRRAAQRLGFSYEGVFRQATVVKGRNRDTAWFAIIDTDWPALKEAFKTWLAPANFSNDGRQKEKLSDLTALVRVASDPSL